MNSTKRTLIIPSISLGNVPQLTCDLIQKKYMRKFDMEDGDELEGSFHELLYCLSGMAFIDEDYSGELSFSATVYANRHKTVFLLQLRSQVIASKFKNFLQCIQKISNLLKVDNVAILSSCQDYGRKSEPNSDIVLKYFSNKETDYKQFEKWTESELNAAKDFDIGFAGDLYLHLTKGNFKVTLYNIAVSEGDNTREILAFANSFEKVLGNYMKITEFDSKKKNFNYSASQSIEKNCENNCWLFPKSWKALENNRVPMNIF
ncbi:hypothetical protein SNEBB_010934 [Seison nebaliae]|nr:hypothetical protein SNEBB_010934 [Seison nebaliae]